MFITTHVTLELKLPTMGIVLRILYTLMFAVIAERPGVQGWALKAPSTRGTRQLTVKHFVLFFKPYVALCRHSHSSSIRDKMFQHHLASPAATVVPNYSPLSCV